MKIKAGISCLVLLYAISVGISAIYIGVVDKADITTFPINLQVWLIVFGIIRLSSPATLISIKDDANRLGMMINTAQIFGFVWLIWGTVLAAIYHWESPRMYALLIAILVLEWILYTALSVITFFICYLNVDEYFAQV